jgi:DNA-binding transcriptional LysR family regulator
MMRTIGAFRTRHPEVVVRADGLTSLRILDGLRAGLLAAGIVRGPVGDPDRVASAPLARVPVDHVAVPPGHRLAGADVVDAADLDGEPVLVVDRAEAPTAHDEIEAYCAAAGARPRWIEHAAIQVERVLDQVALGSGIGWLNSWQAEPAARRFDVAVRPLRPVALFDEFRAVWRAGDMSETTIAFIDALIETCSAS